MVGMNSRAFIVLAVLDQAVVLGALFYLVGTWVLARRDDRRKLDPPRFEPVGSGITAAEPFLIWIDSLPRLGETATPPIRSLGNERRSLQVRD